MMKSHILTLRTLVTDKLKRDIIRHCDVNGITEDEFFRAALRLGMSAVLSLELDELRRLLPSIN